MIVDTNRFHTLNRRLAALAAILILSISLQESLAAAPPLPPVVAQLDVLSTPTLGGEGQMIWAGFANEAPAGAELSFTLRPPGGAPEQNLTLPLDLVKGELCERAYAFQTPQAGDYTITARLKLSADRKTAPIESSKTVLIAPAPRKLEQMAVKESTTYTPLTVNGPLLAGATRPTSYYEGIFYSVDITTSGLYTFECIPGTLSAHMLGLRPRSNGTIATNNCYLPRSSSKIYINLPPGKYEAYLKPIGSSTIGTYSIHVTKGLWIKYFRINDNQLSTIKGIVTLNNTCSEGIPTQYMASESRSFTGAIWKPYSKTPVFTLSSGDGNKTIYFKVRDANGLVSPIQDDEIQRVPLRTLALNGPWLTGYLQQFNQTDWITFTVTRRGSYQIWASQSRPTTSLYGPDSDTRLITTNAANPKIQCELDPGKYYLAIRSNGQYASSYGVNLTNVFSVISRFVINNNAAETTSRLVTLKNTCMGVAPVKYQASIYSDFRDAGMQPYTPTVTFKLPAGNGPKTVYFRVMNSYGNRSDIASDTITLRELVPLPVSATWMPSYINWAGEVDWYRFTVPADGKYTLETQCGTLQDTMLDLLAANGALIRRDDDSGVNYASKITVALKRNTVYQAKVYAAFPTEYGTYSIHLKPAD